MLSDLPWNDGTALKAGFQVFHTIVMYVMLIFYPILYMRKPKPQAKNSLKVPPLVSEWRSLEKMASGSKAGRSSR